MCVNDTIACELTSVPSHQVHFLKPARIGDVLISRARINRCFGTSVEVYVEMLTEHVRTGARDMCTRAYFTFVHIDGNGRPAPVIQVIPETEDEHQRFNAALDRRQVRLRDKKSPPLPPMTWAAQDDASLGMTQGESEEDVLRPRTPRETHAHMTEIVMPGNANAYNITFGGALMAWMEQYHENNNSPVSSYIYGCSPLVLFL